MEEHFTKFEIAFIYPLALAMLTIVNLPCFLCLILFHLLPPPRMQCYDGKKQQRLPKQNVDTESMALILTGLARCGAWGCFDEFNRLQEATLSAISMLIQPIQCSLKDKLDVVQIAGKNVSMIVCMYVVVFILVYEYVCVCV